MSGPVINAGQAGSSLTYTQVWEDTFSADGPGPGPNFIYDLMTDGLNRTGNQGQDRDGNLDSNQSVAGKRWAGWTDGNNDSFVYRQGGNLYVGGDVEAAPDPTRESYSFNGQYYDWSNNRLYAPYMVGQLRRYSNDINGFEVDPNGPNITFGPGHYIECRVSFEEMKTRGFRFSIWIMPAMPNESSAYDNDAANGVEVDIFEYENWNLNGFDASDVIQQKVIGGGVGTTPQHGGGNVKLSDYGLDVSTGFHTIGILWRADGIYWHIDGIETQRDTVRVPQVQQAIQITREINSGVKDGAISPEIPSSGVKRPADVGLYAVSAILDKDKIPTDKGIVDYIRVWSVDGDDSDSNVEVTQTPETTQFKKKAQNTTSYTKDNYATFKVTDPDAQPPFIWDYSALSSRASLVGSDDGPELTLKINQDVASKITANDVTVTYEDGT